MVSVKSVKAREILDSRGNPTVEAEVELTDGTRGVASVPSGASRGKCEAWERRDDDNPRYHKKGVLGAVSAVNEKIAPALIGMSAYDTSETDSVMLALDGMYNKSNLGANAILSVSLALTRAAAKSLHMPLYRYVGGAFISRMPVPMMNILNGGAHAGNNIDIQEFMIIPIGASSFAEAVRICAEIYHSLKSDIVSRGMSVGVGDEGGFAPMLDSDEEALALICDAIKHSGYKAGEDVALGLDIAASEWFSDDNYYLPKRGICMSADELCEYVYSLVSKYPIISVEDAMADSDGYGWRRLTERFSDKKTILIGDDLFVTDAQKIADGAKGGIANAVLIKPNQIGTLTETAEAIRCAATYGYKTAMSHRSGETEDSIIADLAVGFGTHFIKTGAPARSERTAKYNRLMKIESELFMPYYGF